ncbi:MAG: DUF1844 domain-containing protein [Candidatus Omnitrophica bacterium]|nr:DUF1844 domain-containing protein [Candidatus Omnitrophota bacterium]MDD5080364.1 DUF1844 domain-containing protein [Candidatus Omnitrophota bacterium]MDD5441345.1 DUF1844 domain-containing protein [Candidatus Omnitrophota bacterium]
MNDEIKKKVDSDWKEQIEKEKNESEKSDAGFHETSLTIFLSSITMQAMIALGKLENPVTGKTEKSLQQARFLIDTLGILQAKMKGNMTDDEDHFIQEALYNLRMAYIDTQNDKDKQ